MATMGSGDIVVILDDIVVDSSLPMDVSAFPGNLSCLLISYIFVGEHLKIDRPSDAA
jgi:hypothetical protein